MQIDLTGFAPDVDPTTPGVLTACSNVVPTERGLSALASPVAVATLPSACIGATKVRKLDDTKRTFAGTATKLYELISGAWTDVSRASVYTSGPDARWRYCQFGNVTLAVNRSDAVQTTTSGNFADLTAAPKASIIETCGGFVFLFDTNEGTYGDSPDRWWCSGLYDHTTWTPSAATQAATGRFMDSAGRVTGAKRLGQNIIAYKLRNMYIGQYVGAPFVWAWQEVPGEVGAISHESIVDIGTEHYFLGADDFWRFDGVRPVPVGNPVRKWFFESVDQRYLYRVKGFHDRVRKLVFWSFPTPTSGGLCDSWIAYHYKSDRWGAGKLTIEAAVDYAVNGITYDNYGTVSPTWDNGPNLSYDSPYWVSDAPVPAIFNGSHVLQTLTGTPGASSLTTGYVGDDEQFTVLTKVRPRWLKMPDSGTLEHITTDYAGGAETSHGTSSMSSGAFNPLWGGRWHKLTYSLQGAFELASFDVQFDGNGSL